MFLKESKRISGLLIFRDLMLCYIYFHKLNPTPKTTDYVIPSIFE